MVNVALLLHFHQPSYASEAFLQNVIHSCYEPLIYSLSDMTHNPNCNINLNISGALLEWFEKLNRYDLINAIKEMIQRKRIELLATPFYQAPLFFTPIGLVNEQIYHHFKMVRDFFNTEPRGFFPPELIFARDLIPSLKNNHIDFVIIDHVDQLHKKHSGILKGEFFQNIMTLIPRNKNYSISISHGNSSPEALLKQLRNEQHDSLIVIGLDAETFGWYKSNYVDYLREFLGRSSDLEEIHLVQLTEHLNHRSSENFQYYESDEITTWAKNIFVFFKDTIILKMWVRKDEILQKYFALEHFYFRLERLVQSIKTRSLEPIKNRLYNIKNLEIDPLRWFLHKRLLDIGLYHGDYVNEFTIVQFHKDANHLSMNIDSIGLKMDEIMDELTLML